MAPTIQPRAQQPDFLRLESSRVAMRLASRDVTARRRRSAEPLQAFDEGAGAELDIEATFRRQLAGLRRLRPSERPHALRAARDERALALRVLSDRRRASRHARWALWRARLPPPSPGS